MAGQPAALDFSFTAPLQSSLIINASEKSGFALSAAADRKYEHYAQKCSDVGIQFTPLAFETFGGFSETVRKTLKPIATPADNISFQPAGLSVAFSRLSSISLNRSKSWVCKYAACKEYGIIDTFGTRENLWILIPEVKRFNYEFRIRKDQIGPLMMSRRNACSKRKPYNVQFYYFYLTHVGNKNKHFTFRKFKNADEMRFINRWSVV